MRSTSPLSPLLPAALIMALGATALAVIRSLTGVRTAKESLQESFFYINDDGQTVPLTHTITLVFVVSDVFVSGLK